MYVFGRTLLSLQVEASLCAHWLIREWTSCQLSLSNKTPFPALSVFSFPYLLLLVSAYPFLSRPVGYPCSSLSFKDLGLSTARGRGRCKNPTCDYMYKNRHKPAVCPKCGCELTQRNAKGTKVKAQSSQIGQKCWILFPLHLLHLCEVDRNHKKNPS